MSSHKHSDKGGQGSQQRRANNNRRLLRVMAESMPQKIFTVTPKGRLDYFNVQWMTYTGASAEQIRLHGVRQFVHPDDLEEYDRRWAEALAAGESYETEQRLRKYDGSYRRHLMRAVAMRDSSGWVTLWVGSNTDVEDMRQAIDRRHELETKAATLLEQRTQLLALNQAKDEFISLASHQLRTPATGVKQYLAMLLDGYAGQLSEEQAMFVRVAYESNERQITIVNDLLQVARLDAGKVTLNVTQVDVVRLLKGIVNELASKFSQRDQQVVFRAKNSIMAYADAERIRMVFDNILDNAAKYTPPHKTITVSVTKSGERVKISIADQGVGMHAQEIDHIFQKFTRLENPLAGSAEGSGLGLYWAKKIVDLHQGTITVTSTPGEGTTFCIDLPQDGRLA